VALFGNVSSAKPHNAHIAAQVSASFRSNIHPSILRLASQLAQYKLMGADTRAIALLRAMADVIRDYTTPRGEMLNRDLLKTVSAQVGHLVDARAMGTSQGVAVRYLKYEISVVSADLTEDEAKEHLLERIDHFVRDRIVYASKIIRTQAGSKIKHGDVVMTFARSSVVEGTLLAAWERGVRFEVIVIDTRPLLEGKALLSVLLAAGIPCTYGLISSLSSLMPRADLLLLGTSALLANGALYSRAGTATCAMMAREKGIPVIVCCETYKFSERVQLDSFVQNEAGNPRDLLLPAADDADADAEDDAKRTGLIDVAEWQRSPNLAVVNLLYDVTPPRFISAVASEVGLSGPESVGVILRDYKSVLYGV
jgi:translation initiation factor eIF-2B subunit delta